MFLFFKITLTTTASKTSELVDLTYQEPIWRCPEWPATCWCWNPRSVCPGSTADPLAHWQTQDKHRNTPPCVCQKTQSAEGRRKKQNATGRQHWSTRGQLCQRVQWEGWGGGLFFYFRFQSYLPAKSTRFILLTISEGRLFSRVAWRVEIQKKTGQAVMRICRMQAAD